MANSGKRNLTTRQKRAVAALLQSRDVKSAAAAANVGERTLYRWVAEDPDFIAALRAAEAQAIDQAGRVLANRAIDAVGVVLALLGDKGKPAAVRLRAANLVIDYALRLYEMRNLEERLADLEAAVYGNKT